MGMGAGKLEIGDHVYRTQPNGTLQTIQITDIIPIQGTYLTYNLVDMKTGTFLAEDIIVHNCDCFMPGTPISMANGTYKDIEKVEKGELVKVCNIDTMNVEIAPVNYDQYTVLHDDVHELHLENGVVLKPGADHPSIPRKKVGRQSMV